MLKCVRLCALTCEELLVPSIDKLILILGESLRKLIRLGISNLELRRHGESSVSKARILSLLVDNLCSFKNRFCKFTRFILILALGSDYHWSCLSATINSNLILSLYL